MRPKYELADILRLYKKDFLSRYKVSSHVLTTLDALQVCRTAVLGGHKTICKDCGHTQISYNSCRNRHCPKCQATDRERWIMQREIELLPVPYFHIVFTLPGELNTLAVSKPKEVYNALFRASWQTIKTFAADQKHLGAKTGMTAVLHTWGQNISLHPHLHCIIPAGGISPQGKWKLPVKYKGKPKREIRYLFPKKAMSKVFRAKYMNELRKGVDVPQKTAKALFSKDWVVYAKRAFGGPGQVIEYLGRYTHKIAVSNHRLKSIKGRKICFKYKDYKQAAKVKIMTLDAPEFIRRFCMHILPERFIRIRHYGILASRNKATELNKAKDFFELDTWEKQEIAWEEIAQNKLGISLGICKKCLSSNIYKEEILPVKRGPPPAILFEVENHEF